MRKLLYAQAATLIVLAPLHLYFGMQLRFFWKISWWDIPLHILGGMWAGFFCMWVARYFYRRLTLTHVILGAFLIGVGWEVFEYVLGIGGSPFMSYPVDTAKDLFDDIVGGFLAGVIASLL